MVSSDRRKMTFREAWQFKERREGHAIGLGPGLIRLIEALWYCTVGKKRFVPSRPDPKLVRAQKKRQRQNRQKQHGRHSR